MANGERIRLAIVGAGEIGITRGITAKALPEYELVCIVDRQRIMAKIAGKQLGVRSYTSYRDAAREEEIDAVLIATSPRAHCQIAIEALEKGKHVFCEKPLSTSLEESHKMYEAARRAEVVHQVGYNLRFHPTFKKTKEIIQGGGLGEIKYVRVVGHKSEAVRPETKGEKKNREERQGIYGAFAVHALDLMIWYGGELSWLLARTSQVHSSELEDLAVGVCQFANDAMGLIDLGWSHHGIDRNYLSLMITGTQGTVTVDDDQIQLYLEKEWGEFQEGETTILGIQLPSSVGFELGGKGLSPGLEFFAQSIREKRSSSPDWLEGYRVDEVVEGIRRSSLQGVRVSFPLEVNP